jgi:protoporphyrin/coproporphyrin ferrochelatase
MPRLSGTPSFEHGRKSRIGVLLCNVGTPDGPTTAAVRRYLAEFLSDPRIVELPRLLWLPLLYGVILNTRPRRSAAAYASIWGSEGSPLLTASRRLCAALDERFEIDHGDDVRFALGMRYGNPSISAGLEQLLAAEARRILIVPLYPQYASASTGSVYDAVLACCRRLRWIPEFRFVNEYHADPRYVSAVARSISEYWSQNGRSDRLLMSFHGIPRETFLAGDPYYCQCQATGRLVAEHLALDAGAWALSFQSRVGPKRWLEPYTDATLRDWARGGLCGRLPRNARGDRRAVCRIVPAGGRDDIPLHPGLERWRGARYGPRRHRHGSPVRLVRDPEANLGRSRTARRGGTRTRRRCGAVTSAETSRPAAGRVQIEGIKTPRRS